MDENKGPWADVAEEGIVPPPDEAPDEPQLTSDVVGEETGDDEPATEQGIDMSAGDNADATTDGGAKRPEGAEPDLRDAAQPPRQVDR